MATVKGIEQEEAHPPTTIIIHDRETGLRKSFEGMKPEVDGIAMEMWQGGILVFTTDSAAGVAKLELYWPTGGWIYGTDARPGYFVPGLELSRLPNVKLMTEESRGEEEEEEGQ